MDSDMPCHAILPQFIVQVSNKDLKHSSEFQSAVKIEVWKAFMFALVECFRAEKGVCVAVLYICLSFYNLVCFLTCVVMSLMNIHEAGLSAACRSGFL